jgi:hypothetical protein
MKIEQPQEVIALHCLTNDARAQRFHSSKGKGDQLNQDTKVTNQKTIYSSLFVSGQKSSSHKPIQINQKNSYQSDADTYAKKMVNNCKNNQGRYNGLIRILSDLIFLVYCYESI